VINAAFIVSFQKFLADVHSAEYPSVVYWGLENVIVAALVVNCAVSGCVLVNVWHQRSWQLVFWLTFQTVFLVAKVTVGAVHPQFRPGAVFTASAVLVETPGCVAVLVCGFKSRGSPDNSAGYLEEVD